MIGEGNAPVESHEIKSCNNIQTGGIKLNCTVDGEINLNKSRRITADIPENSKSTEAVETTTTPDDVEPITTEDVDATTQHQIMLTQQHHQVMLTQQQLLGEAIQLQTILCHNLKTNIEADTATRTKLNPFNKKDSNKQQPITNNQQQQQQPDQQNTNEPGSKIKDNLLNTFKAYFKLTIIIQTT